MFKVNILSAPNGEFLKRELFKDHAHAISWSNEQSLKTGLHYEVIDLNEDLEFQKEERVKKIKKESPSLEEKIDAIIAKERGDNSKMLELIQKIEVIEQKYPEVKGKL